MTTACLGGDGRFRQVLVDAATDRKAKCAVFSEPQSGGGRVRPLHASADPSTPFELSRHASQRRAADRPLTAWAVWKLSGVLNWPAVRRPAGPRDGLDDPGPPSNGLVRSAPSPAVKPAAKPVGCRRWTRAFPDAGHRRPKLQSLDRIAASKSRDGLLSTMTRLSAQPEPSAFQPIEATARRPPCNLPTGKACGSVRALREAWSKMPETAQWVGSPSPRLCRLPPKTEPGSQNTRLLP